MTNVTQRTTTTNELNTTKTAKTISTTEKTTVPTTTKDILKIPSIGDILDGVIHFQFKSDHGQQQERIARHCERILGQLLLNRPTYQKKP